MNKLYHKFPFIIELFFNGIFIALFSLDRTGGYEKIISPSLLSTLTSIFAKFVPIVILLVMIMNYLLNRDLADFFRKQVFSIIVFIPLLMLRNDFQFIYWLATVHLFSSTLAVFDPVAENIGRKSKLDLGFLYKLNLKPAQVVLITFFMIIIIGAFLLVLPISATANTSISFIDALFMATSATCVTGLASISLSDSFSIPGQMIVLILIQIGGLGIMTLSSSMTILMGRTLGMKEQVAMQDVLDISSMEELMKMIVDIVKYTFVLELFGGVVLTTAFFMEGMEFGQSVYYGFFHAISAFCNAGFSLFNNSLEGYAGNSVINMTISILVLCGGLGFVVLKELKTAIMKRKSFKNLTVYTKIILTVNACLLGLGTIFIFMNEFLHSLVEYSLFDKLMVSFFQAMTTRTAGFNTIALNDFHPHTLYIMTLFMFIGASPGSTGGGIKNTTFALLFQSVRATLKGRNEVEFFDRKIPNYLVVKAISVIIISLMIVSFFIFLMMKIEDNKSFLVIFFEVVSAFATVGLSLGATASLSSLGKLVLVLLMFVGRVGPLTMVLAIAQKNKHEGSIGFPDGRVMIG
jgi:trk system potassium uptake protein TrkH